GGTDAAIRRRSVVRSPPRAALAAAGAASPSERRQDMTPSKEELKRQVCAAIERHGDRLIDLGETIRHEPELGFKEFKTAARVAAVFEELRVPHRTGLAVTGVRADLQGAKPGPTLALIGELDALVVSGHPLADPLTGAAHACGHNAQVTAVVGAT